jgi:hypothetical protein
MFIRLNRKGQSTAEYAIVFGLVVAAAIAMQTYVKRGLQGRVRDAVDFTDQNEQNKGVVEFSGNQYEPYYLGSQFNTASNSETKEQAQTGGAVARDIQEHSNRQGVQVIDRGRADND